ncbi:MAG: hypothetical protein ACYDCJ_11910 [Gammaproteobacteria bacterium]
MPLTSKGRKILRQMEKEYRAEKGKAVFYAARNKSRITGVDMTRKPAVRKSHKKSRRSRRAV